MIHTFTYKVVDSFYEPKITTTLPRYAVYRKRRLFGWKYVGSSSSCRGEDIIKKDLSFTQYKYGDWVEVWT